MVSVEGSLEKRLVDAVDLLRRVCISERSTSADTGIEVMPLPGNKNCKMYNIFAVKKAA